MLYYYQYPIGGTFRLIGRKLRCHFLHWYFILSTMVKSSSSSGSTTNIDNNNYEDVDEAIFTGSSSSSR